MSVCTLTCEHADVRPHAEVSAPTHLCAHSCTNTRAAARALTGVQTHADVQQVQRIADTVQAQPQRCVPLLHLREAAPGTAGGVTGPFPPTARLPSPPTPRRTCR